MSTIHTGSTPKSAWWRSRGTLDRLLSGRANSFGFLRLVLATSVVYSHVFPLSTLNGEDPLWRISGHQTDVGKMAVVGFFVLSGYMITSSGERLGTGRYVWHRILRIFPGLWVNVLITALVVAPLLFIHLHGSTAGFWHSSEGPFEYIRGTSTTAISSGYDISKVMATAMHRGLADNIGLDGALWSLRYELFCYVVVAILAAGGALRRAPKTVPLLALLLWSSMVINLMDAPTLRGFPSESSTSISVPVLGGLNTHYLVYLGFAFLLGASFRLFRHRFHINDVCGVLSAVLVLATFHWGAFAVIGYPAFAYLLIWLGVRLPSWLHWVGRKHDYSYGMYIYGFVVEQVLRILYHANTWGTYRYFATAAGITLVVAVLSWHLVESQAMKLKNWTPPTGWIPAALRPGHRARHAVEQPAAASAATGPSTGPSVGSGTGTESESARVGNGV